MTLVRPLTAALGVAALLAGCAAPEITTAPVAYTATKPLDAKGSTVIEVRSYKRANNSAQEVTGVPCTFQGDGFRSSFATPARVIAPNMQVRTPVAAVTCTYQGASRSVTLQPYNKTTANTVNGAMAAGAGAGVLGVLVGAAVGGIQNAARDENNDVWGYQDSVKVNFD